MNKEGPSGGFRRSTEPGGGALGSNREAPESNKPSGNENPASPRKKMQGGKKPARPGHEVERTTKSGLKDEKIGPGETISRAKKSKGMSSQNEKGTGEGT